jgi:hypothetical protein
MSQFYLLRQIIDFNLSIYSEFEELWSPDKERDWGTWRHSCAVTVRLYWTKKCIQCKSNTREWGDRKRHEVRIIVEDFSFLGYNTVQLGTELSTFRRNPLLRCLWQPWMRPYIPASTKLQLDTIPNYSLIQYQATALHTQKSLALTFLMEFWFSIF